MTSWMEPGRARVWGVAWAAALGVAAAVRGEPAEGTPSSFRALTFNVLQGGLSASNVGFYDRDYGGSRLDDIARVIARSGADVVGVQELHGSGEKLQDALGPEWRRVGTILSRYDMSPIETTDYLSVCRVRLPGGDRVVVINAHWWPTSYGPKVVQDRIRDGTVPADPKDFEREVLAACHSAGGSRGYQRTVEAAKRFLAAGETVVLVGDFNEPSHLDWTERAAVDGMDRWVKNPCGTPLRFAIRWRWSRLLEEAGLQDAYRSVYPDEVKRPGCTWTPAYAEGSPGRCAWGDQVLDRIDRIYFAGRGLRVVGAAVVGESDAFAEVVHEGPWPSDHRAVLATFELHGNEAPSGEGGREESAAPAEAVRAATVRESALARNLSLVGIALEEREFTLWGASPLAHGGKTHLYVARWPEPNVDPAWRKSSEIAHYVSQSPEGPFRFSDVALTGSGKETWDRYSAHNPEARHYEEKFVLLYVSNSDYHQPPHPLNQRIGMAVAPSSSGPWRRVGRNGLLLESSGDPDHWTHGSHVVNPALLRVGSRYHLYFKSKCRGQLGMVYGVATADHLEGPYEIADRPLTTEGVVIEDGAVFDWEDKICLLTTDNHGKVTGVRGGGALWVSEDGLDFRKEWIQVGYDRIPRYFPDYDPLRVVRVYGQDPKFERPKILNQVDRPRYLYAPSGWNVFGGPRTVLHVLRVDLEASDGPLPVD